MHTWASGKLLANFLNSVYNKTEQKEALPLSPISCDVVQWAPKAFYINKCFITQFLAAVEVHFQCSRSHHLADEQMSMPVKIGNRLEKQTIAQYTNSTCVHNEAVLLVHEYVPQWTPAHVTHYYATTMHFWNQLCALVDFEKIFAHAANRGYWRLSQ